MTDRGRGSFVVSLADIWKRMSIFPGDRTCINNVSTWRMGVVLLEGPDEIENEDAPNGMPTHMLETLLLNGIHI